MIQKVSIHEQTVARALYMGGEEHQGSTGSLASLRLHSDFDWLSVEHERRLWRGIKLTTLYSGTGGTGTFGLSRFPFPAESARSM